MIIVFTLLLILSNGVKSKAQFYNFQNYSVEDGLAQNSVSDIIQDRSGYIWFATSGGLSRFDGLNFRNITTHEGLSGNRVSAIIEDREGNLWIGTNEGISIIIPRPSFKSANFHIINIDTTNGLVGISVTAIIEDTKGFIWFGTNNGLAKLDPKLNEWKKADTLAADAIDFEVFNTQNGLASNVVRDIFEDRKGIIWIATDRGVSRLQIVDSTFMIHNFTTDDGLSHNMVNTIFEDKDGVFWIATFNSLMKVNFDHRSYRIQSIESFDEVKMQCFSIFQGNKDNLWFDRYKFKPAINFNSGFVEHNIELFYAHLTGMVGATVLSTFQDREDNLWFGSAGSGVSKYSGKIFENYSKIHGLRGNSVRDIIEDQYGNIWIATGHGISRFHPDYSINKQIYLSGKGFENYNKITNGILYNSIWSMLEDSKGNIWAGTGDGLSVYSPEKTKGGKVMFHSFHLKDGLRNTAILALCEDSKGNIWAGSFVGVSVVNLEDLDEVKAGRKKFTTYTTQNGLGSNRISAIHEDKKGNLWIGTDGGLSKFVRKELNAELQGRGYVLSDRKNKMSDSVFSDSIFFVNFTTEDGLANARIRSIAEDPEGNLWIGTQRGILKYIQPAYKGSKGSFRNFSTKHGLSSDTPYLLIFDDKGYLYVGTNKGIDKFNIKADPIQLVKHYGKLEGFIGIETNHNAVCKDRNGDLWFGTDAGVTKFNLKLDKPNLTEPLTHITRLQLFFEDHDWSVYSDTIDMKTGLPVGLALPFDKNHLTFNFQGISLTIPEKVKYQWKLEGFDNAWSPVSQKTEATYSNLLHGRYTFMVKACNNDGLWNKNPTSFNFSILPPWWQTLWFYFLIGFTGLGVIFGYIKIREKNLKREKRILEEKVKIRTAKIQRQNEEIKQKNISITDSINYAKIIQQAMLSPIEGINRILPESFILFKPKDIVSGDFYWFSKIELEKERNGETDREIETENRGIGETEIVPDSPIPPFSDSIIIAAVDCTGHGVPGAFMSVIGNDLLNEIVSRRGITEPVKILRELNDGVVEALKQKGQPGEARDGMDIALCNIQLINRHVIPNKKRDIGVLQYAGAYNSLYIVRKNIGDSELAKMNKVVFFGNDLAEIKGNRFPIGMNKIGKDKNFTNHSIMLQKGDKIYIFSDGYADQFGGKKGKKFTYKRFKELIVSIQDSSMSEQKLILDQNIENWKGEEEQLDDILMIGFEV